MSSNKVHAMHRAITEAISIFNHHVEEITHWVGINLLKKKKKVI